MRQNRWNLFRIIQEPFAAYSKSIGRLKSYKNCAKLDPRNHLLAICIGMLDLLIEGFYEYNQEIMDGIGGGCCYFLCFR